MTLIRKQLLAEISPSAEKKPVAVVVSTGSPDRDGDTIDPMGWDLDAFRANPVVLYGHDRFGMPVAKATNIRVEGAALRADVEFAPTEYGSECEQLVRGGFLNAVSAGFRPIECGPRQDEDGVCGVAFLKQELVEFSFVAVPANPEALVESRSAREQLIKSFNPAASSRPSPGDPAPAKEAAQMDPVADPKGAAQPATVTMTPEQLDAAIAKAANSAVEKFARKTVSDPTAAIVEDAAEKGAQRDGQKAPIISKWSRAKRLAELEPGKDKGLGAARAIMAYSLAKATPGMLHEDAAKAMGFLDVADAIDHERQVRKALGVSTISAGAAFIPEVFASTFIDELHPLAVVRGLIPSEGLVKLDKGESFSIPEVTSRPTSYFLGEASPPTNSTPGTGLRNVDLKWLATEVIVGKDWLNGSIVNGDQLVRSLMLRSAALKEDLALVEGSGGENEPRGIKGWAGNSVAATAAPAYAESIDDLEALEYYLEGNNVPVDENCAFLGHPIHFKGLRKFTDAMGRRPWREEMKLEGTLNGHKFAKSSQLNITGANSCFYFGNFAHAMLVDGMAMEIEEDSQYVSSGTTHSASARRQIVLRLWRRFGFGVKHANAFAYLSTCTWGA